MALRVALLALLLVGGSLAYLPHDAGPKENFLSDALLREVVERMGKDLAEAADSYMELPGSDSRMPLMARAAKDLESEQFDYDSISPGNPSPSLRDQEYMHHSTLLAQYLANNNEGENDDDALELSAALSRVAQHTDNSRNPQMKQESALPAYCNPPNPCPVGYSEAQGCIKDEFENTAAFSRAYQAEQECMCDAEHMFVCPGGGGTGDGLDRYLAQRLQLVEHNNLVAKKFHAKKSVNPYLTGERLPVAAKKGKHVDTTME